jgi:hypothetical protein
MDQMFTIMVKLKRKEQKPPPPGMPNVEVVYDTSPGTTTRVAHRGSLIGGTKTLDPQAG